MQEAGPLSVMLRVIPPHPQPGSGVWTEHMGSERIPLTPTLAQRSALGSSALENTRKLRHRNVKKPAPGHTRIGLADVTGKNTGSPVPLSLRHMMGHFL